MAALFKVCRHDNPKERKMVKASSMDELISAAKNKLNLTNEKYKIYTEDFTDIDENDILMELAQATKGQLILTLVPDEIPWNSMLQIIYTSGQPTANESSSQSVQPNSTDKVAVSSTSSLLGQNMNLSDIFQKCSMNVQLALKNDKTLEPKERKSLVHSVSAYMIYNLKNTSRKTAENISTQIINTYPNSFASKIGDKNIDGAMEALRQTIYYAVNYEKGQSMNKSQLSLSLESDDESTEKPLAQDEYGCVSYLPLLPSSETLDSQEEKRLKLIEHFKSSNDTINEEILTLIIESYFLQRRQIHIFKNLINFFLQWPHFHHDKVIIQHADLLLGKDCHQIWKESINTYAKPVNCWSKNKEIFREMKVKKNRSKSTNPDADEKYVRGVLKRAKAHYEVVKNEEPYQNIIFGFIVRFMKEDEKYLYVFIDDEDLDDNQLDVPVANPVLIIRGPNLYAAGNTYKVIIEKKIIIHVPLFLDGLLITFLSYYVFGFAYPKEIEGTLEAIQRLFLKICPPKGTKRGGKRKATNIHPKVTNMINELENYME